MTWLGEARYTTIDVDHCRIGYFEHGRRHGSPLLLVHGGAAHAGWWLRLRTAPGRPPPPHHRSNSPVTATAVYAPTTRRDVGERVAHVIDALQAGPADLVAHSMGGLASIYAAALFPDRMRRLVLVDSPLRRLVPLKIVPEDRVVHYYESAEEAISRFRLVPEGSEPPRDGFSRR